MAIKAIKKRQFDALQPTHKPMSRLVVEELEWFANEQQTMLGAVFYDPAEESWGWVVLCPDQKHEFRVAQLHGRHPSANEAGVKLRETMARLDQAGINLPPPGALARLAG